MIKIQIAPQLSVVNSVSSVDTLYDIRAEHGSPIWKYRNATTAPEVAES